MSRILQSTLLIGDILLLIGVLLGGYGISFVACRIVFKKLGLILKSQEWLFWIRGGIKGVQFLSFFVFYYFYICAVSELYMKITALSIDAQGGFAVILLTFPATIPFCILASFLSTGLAIFTTFLLYFAAGAILAVVKNLFSSIN